MTLHYQNGYQPSSHTSRTTRPSSDRRQFAIRFPDADFGGAQDEEWCEVYLRGDWQKFRFHDYDRLYKVPGLYEHLFYDILKCCSPGVVVGLLSDVLDQWPFPGTELRVLDLGAGNGMVGDELRALGINYLCGVDIIPEAAEATNRDRPDLYDDYLVTDLCNPPAEDGDRLGKARFNCLSTVAALGFGDIPPLAFANSFNLISSPGWLAFNIKEDFLDGSDSSGFSGFMRRLSDEKIVQIQAYRRYNHRLSVNGRRLFYVAMVARKLRDIPPAMIEELKTGA